MGSLPVKTEANLIVVDPKDPDRVYTASDANLYRSDDAGETWEVVGRGLPDSGLTALALDPRQPQRLYAAAQEGTLYLTEDGATSWRRP